MMRFFAAALAACVVCGCAKKKGVEPPIAPVATAIPPSAPPLESEQAVVTAARGVVQLQRGPDGQWSFAQVGDRLGMKDALRTAEGEADVAVEGVKVRLHEFSRLDMSKIDKRALHTRVHGSLEGDVDPTGKLDVDIGDSDAMAHSEGGHFFVTADGKGVVAVASVTGTVHLTSAGKAVDVGKGEVSRIDAGTDAPGKPAAALRRVLLSVQWPGIKETNKATLPVSGRVEPGSRVFIQGQQVSVDAGGTFRSEVPLKQGKQKIAIVTVDALGRRKQVDTTVRRDDSLPDVKVKKKLWQWH